MALTLAQKELLARLNKAPEGITITDGYRPAKRLIELKLARPVLQDFEKKTLLIKKI